MIMELSKYPKWIISYIYISMLYNNVSVTHPSGWIKHIEKPFIWNVLIKKFNINVDNNEVEVLKFI